MYNHIQAFLLRYMVLRYHDRASGARRASIIKADIDFGIKVSKTSATSLVCGNHSIAHISLDCANIVPETLKRVKLLQGYILGHFTACLLPQFRQDVLKSEVEIL